MTRNMRIQVLGCSGAIAQNARTTSFLVDDHILVDAGTGVGDLPLAALAKIDHVLLTHSHLDHIAALPLMLDSVGGSRSEPVQVYALPETIAALKTHIFNNVIWPDFSVIPSPEQPFLRFNTVQVGQVLKLGWHSVEVLPAEHSVPAVGYAVDTPKGQWVFTGDTERNPAFWARLKHLNVAMLVIETAFSEREAALAKLSRHLCPSTLAAELDHLPTGVDLHFPLGITHTKPAETEAIQSDVRSLGVEERYPLVWLEAGQVFEF